MTYAIGIACVSLITLVPILVASYINEREIKQWCKERGIRY